MIRRLKELDFSKIKNATSGHPFSPNSSSYIFISNREINYNLQCIMCSNSDEVDVVL